jgi:hypothetical protein
MRPAISVIALLSILSSPLLSQGLETRASKNDWEEINFEYNSSVLSDGYPSLLRLAELLNKNAGYRVRIEGHTDGIGSASANEKLGLARAITVRDFLVKYGARPEQIQTSTRGESDPEARGEKKTYGKTDVARWMNRRVVLTVTDDQGRTVSDGGVNQAIQAMDQSKAIAQQQQQQQACCDQILKRLDRLDDIAKMLKDMADQNNALKQEVADLKAKQADLEKQVAGLPKPLNEQQTAQVVDTRLEKFRDPRFAILGLNIGADSNKDITFMGKGRYFAPFKDHFAVQAQGEYLYFHDQKEGQIDVGLVDRIGNFQAGLFSSFKHVSLSGMQSGGNLGQAALTLDYIFGLGRVGMFGTRAFLNDAVVNTAPYQFISGTNPDGTTRMTVAPNLFNETYLKVVDQIGLSTTLGLWGNNYIEANLGYLKSFAHADRPGGTIRLVFPVMDRLAFTVQGGMNETLVAANNWGEATVGIQFGNFTRPRDYQTVTHPVPVDVPRVRWELLTRTVRRGASPPVADAGPNQIGVAAGTITLNGSNSYDPNGEKLTYQWAQESGPSVPLNGANMATATFTAASGQTYLFRLTVTNESGLTSSARVRITTQAAAQVQIVFFASNPPSINSGQASQLSWKVLGATSVSISGIGSVAAQGSTSVSPTQTTTYQLKATGSGGSQNATATVVVNGTGNATQISGCAATPSSISAGQSSTISYQTQNATAVTVTPTVGGSIPISGSFPVTPTQTTTYTITASGQSGQSASCAVTVNVGTTPGTGPMITTFTANPAVSPSAGSPVTLTCLAQNATNVTITGVGALSSRGTVVVKPTTDTLYTCVATGANNAQDTRSVQVRVGNSTGQGPQVVIVGAPMITTTNTDLILDAAGSRSPYGWEPLSFRWKSVGPLFADIDNERTARALVHLTHGPGDYNFEVYVMDRHGNVTVGTVLVRLLATTP